MWHKNKKQPVKMTMEVLKAVIHAIPLEDSEAFFRKYHPWVLDQMMIEKAPAFKAALDKWFDKTDEPGKASNYFKHFKKLMQEEEGCFVFIVLFVRVSACTQNYSGNLKSQIEWLKKKLEQYEDVVIVAEIKDVASGWKEGREGLKQAADIARKWGAVILGESSDRFIRSIYYHSIKNPSAQPTDAEYKNLIMITKGTTLATMLHPDRHWKKVRSHQTKRGQQTKGNKGGRPKVNKPGYKKRRRFKKLARVLQLRRKGASWGDITALTGVPKKTASDWVKKYD